MLDTSLTLIKADLQARLLRQTKALEKTQQALATIERLEGKPTK